MATAQKGVKVSKIAAAVVAHTSENPGTKPETVKLSTEITARMLTACETAGLLAANDESHKSKQSELGLAKFVEYWNAVKPELKKPENAAKFGAMPDQKSQGKYNISEYLTQCVSRIRGAMTHKIKVVVKGVPVPQSKLAARIAEANKLAAEKKRNDPASSTYDKHYELRVKISARLVEIAGIVRKGSHSAGVLKQVDTVLGRIADSLKNDKSGDAEEETETAEKQAA
jgi:hypothetical protein